MNAASLTLDGVPARAGVEAVSHTAEAEAVTVVYGTEPWSRADLVRSGALTAAGGALLGAGWVGASNRLELADQVAWLNVGVGGLLVATAGGLAWLRSGLRSVRGRKAAVLTELQAGRAVPAETVATTAALFVAAPAMTRYHRPGCSLVTGKPAAAASLAAHSEAGRRPCGMCVQ